MCINKINMLTMFALQFEQIHFYNFCMFKVRIDDLETVYILAPMLFFSYSTQLSMKLYLLIDMKLPKIVCIFIFIGRELFNFQLCLARKKCYNK